MCNDTKLGMADGDTYSLGVLEIFNVFQCL